MIELALVYN